MEITLELIVVSYRGSRQSDYKRELRYTIGPLCDSLCRREGSCKVGAKAWHPISSMGMAGQTVVSSHS